MSRFNELVSAYRRARPALRAEILGGAERHVESQVGLLTSGDARAVGLLSVCTALAAAAIAVAVENRAATDRTLFLSAASFAACSIGATWAAVWALWPDRVCIPGWRPATYFNDVRRQKTAVDAETIALLDRRIDLNHKSLTDLGWRTRFAVAFLTASPLAAISAALGIGPLIVALYLLAAVMVHLWRSRRDDLAQCHEESRASLIVCNDR